MKSKSLVIGLLNFYILCNNAYNLSVKDLVAKSMEEVEPHQCVLWTSLFDGVVDKGQHLKNYQIF